ncbi:hypothetical protein HID58_046022 [Brassica napus]|uniref:Uncharacterized protein n=1 Tax=Brassica napus TaxID=3708 RepID=A0ABQ8AV92_BRANA|nr:hypothetical protein HID58_046022 [Brassica napus]
MVRIKAIREESTRKGQGGLSFTAEVFEIITSVNKENHRAIHLYINSPDLKQLIWVGAVVREITKRTG